MTPAGVRTERAARPAHRDERQFRLAFGVALLAHALLLAGFYEAPVRQLGDPGGLDGAIAIDLASLSDVNGTATVSDIGGQPPASPQDAGAAAPPIDIPPLFPSPEPTPPTPAPRPSAETAAAQKSADLASPAEPRVPDERRSEPTEPGITDKTAPSQKKTPPQARQDSKPEPRPPEPRAAPAQPRQAPLAAPKLDLSLPSSAFDRPTFTGSGAGLERPAGITRSGENDDFARGVIRALQRTMPQLSNTRGQVTVRITLDGRGNIVATVVTRPSGVQGLDQNVVFATKQTSYPIPPRNHVAADLVFLITYIYR